MQKSDEIASIFDQITVPYAKYEQMLRARE